MSDLLQHLPVNSGPTSSEDFAKIQPYIPAAPATSAPASKLTARGYILVIVLFVLLSLPFWNILNGKVNSYLVLGIKILLFVAGLFLFQKYVTL